METDFAGRRFFMAYLDESLRCRTQVLAVGLAGPTV